MVTFSPCPNATTGEHRSSTRRDAYSRIGESKFTVGQKLVVRRVPQPARDHPVGDRCGRAAIGDHHAFVDSEPACNGRLNGQQSVVARDGSSRTDYIAVHQTACQRRVIRRARQRADGDGHRAAGLNKGGLDDSATHHIDRADARHNIQRCAALYLQCGIVQGHHVAGTPPRTAHGEHIKTIVQTQDGSGAQVHRGVSDRRQPAHGKRAEHFVAAGAHRAAHFQGAAAVHQSLSRIILRTVENDGTRTIRRIPRACVHQGRSNNQI